MKEFPATIFRSFWPVILRNVAGLPFGSGYRHAKDWPRQRAVDYLTSNTALSLHEIGTEVDRYIAWPGQALAYKVGELSLWELRSQA